MAGQTVGIAVIGVGGMGIGHCKNCQEIDEVELKAVADADADRAKEVGEDLDVAWSGDHKEVMALDEVDAAIIATPHNLHPPLAMDAFDNDLHVLSEKPMAARVGMADRMIQGAEDAGKVLSVMFQKRTLPAVRKARELVENGDLGEIARTLLEFPDFRSQAYYDSGSWRATWEGEGGGVLLNQAPHIMDIFTMLAGLPEEVRGFCEIRMHHIEVEDHAEARLEYENGATGFFHASTCEVGPGSRLELVGDKGILLLEGDDTLRFWRYDNPIKEFNETNDSMWAKPEAEEVELELPECDSGHKAIIRNFARAILHGEELISPGDQALKSLELANAIRLSSNKGEAVKLPIDRQEYHELIDYLIETSTFEKEVREVKRETDPQFQ